MVQPFQKKHLPLFVYFALWFIYFSIFWARAIFIDKEGNLFVGHINIWGDWPLHFSLGSSMAFRYLFPVGNPLLIGSELGYPFFCNFISALLIRLGVPFFNAFLVPSFVFSVGLVFVLFIFYRELWGSSKVGVVASLIFLFNGGLGFIEFLKDFGDASNPLTFLWNLPQKYTVIDAQHIIWGSVIDSMIVPQRSFNFGFPVAVLVLILLYRFMVQDKETKQLGLGILISLIAAGLFGLMPLFHTHSFMALFMIIPFYLLAAGLKNFPSFSRFKWGEWLIFLVCGGILARYILGRFFETQTTQTNFFNWVPGWYANYLEISWFEFWLRNWGFVPILAALGWVHFAKRQAAWARKVYAFLLFAPFFAFFAIVNLFQLHFWIWDNTKLLVWASLGFSGLAAYFLDWLGRADFSWLTHGWSFFARKTFMRIKAIPVWILFGVCIFSGALDAFRILQRHSQTYLLYLQEDLVLADWVRNNTSPDSIWLTGTREHHWLPNLTGRQALIMETNFLWHHGYSFYGVLSDVYSMFRDPSRKDLFDKYKVDYINISAHDLSVLSVDLKKMNKFYPKVYQLHFNQIYQVPKRTVSK